MMAGPGAATPGESERSFVRQRRTEDHRPILMTILSFHVVPNAKENRVVGQHGHAIKVKLKAKPIEGEANAMLRKFLAEQLGISGRLIVLERGQKSRDKIVRIEVLRFLWLFCTVRGCL